MFVSSFMNGFITACTGFYLRMIWFCFCVTLLAKLVKFNLMTFILSNRQHLSNYDCLDVRRIDNHYCSVLYCVRHLGIVICTYMWAVLTLACWFRFRFCFRVFILANILYFCVAQILLMLVLLAIVLLGLVSSLLANRLAPSNVSENGPFYVRWDVNIKSINQPSDCLYAVIIWAWQALVTYTLCRLNL